MAFAAIEGAHMMGAGAGITLYAVHCVDGGPYLNARLRAKLLLMMLTDALE
jgi:hypothetical protein